jgi:hypothetical protein
MNHELWSCVACGVEFIDENSGGPGVRLQKRHQEEGLVDLEISGEARITKQPNFIGKSGNGSGPTA